ncbi:MAG: hypothetical protein ABIK99_05785 [candidate division WOR-3 bacterium]
MTRIQKGKKEQNGYVERSHRTDDEYFYIPYGKEIKDTMSLFLLAYPRSEVSPKADSWIRYYNRERQHFGKELNGMRPEEYLRKTLPKIDPDISLFPPVFLYKIAVSDFWGGHYLCKQYTILLVENFSHGKDIMEV